MGNIILSNIVKKDTLREVQRKTLADIASYLKTSFGPFGSNSIIKRGPEAATEYTKDGHDILSQIKYNGPIESTIIEDLVDITRYVVNVVGDGTTSAVEMSNLIFDGISTLEGKYRAYDIIFAFKKVVDKIIDEIKKNGRECTLDDIYDIAYTSTNGNERLAQNLYTLYKDYGFDIYIDLQVALSSPEDIIKIYDGMNINSGYTDSVFANRDKAICEIHNPRIYFFESPVDTPEMIGLFDSIVYNNIIKSYETKAKGKNTASDPVPTVIVVPFISADMSAYMNDLTKFIMKFPLSQKPPIAIIKAYNLEDQLNDMALMCGAPVIKKYINDEIHKSDIDKGLAPTVDTVPNFFGSCELISITKDNTKVIRPAKMFNENGEYSEEFNNLLKWCENELERVTNEDKNSVVKYDLKKRINSLKSNLIEYFVGGISISDRDNDRALLEDAIKNCRSAIEFGVGYGANVEGLRAVSKIKENADTLDKEHDSLEVDIINIIYKAYIKMIELLYSEQIKNTKTAVDDLKAMYTEMTGFNYADTVSDTTDSDTDTGLKMLYSDGFASYSKTMDFVRDLIEKGAYNLRTDKFDGKVKSSIMSDVAILEAISRIITRMATAEQFILPSPAHNVYEMKED